PVVEHGNAVGRHHDRRLGQVVTDYSHQPPEPRVGRGLAVHGELEAGIPFQIPDLARHGCGGVLVHELVGSGKDPSSASLTDPPDSAEGAAQVAALGCLHLDAERRVLSVAHRSPTVSRARAWASWRSNNADVAFVSISPFRSAAIFSGSANVA